MNSFMDISNPLTRNPTTLFCSQENNFVINDISAETEEDYEDQLKQEASNETFSASDTFKEGRKALLLRITLLP